MAAMVEPGLIPGKDPPWPGFKNLTDDAGWGGKRYPQTLPDGLHNEQHASPQPISSQLWKTSKRVSPHTIRHTAATHLLHSGVDINTIRAWLGHVSLTTTNVYAEVDLEMKAKALANCEVKGKKKTTPWKEDKGLMEFLRTL